MGTYNIQFDARMVYVCITWMELGTTTNNGILFVTFVNLWLHRLVTSLLSDEIVTHFNQFQINKADLPHDTDYPYPIRFWRFLITLLTHTHVLKTP